MDRAMSVGGTVVLLRNRMGDGLETLLIRRPDRGSFAGGWVFPGGVVENADVESADVETAGERVDADEEPIAARAAIRECEEEVGVRPADLVTLSCWVPPVEAPKRVRTWFFLAAAPDGDLVLAPDEVVEARWLTPADALSLHEAGELRLFPPTWVTLQALAKTASVAGALAAASVPELYATHIVEGGIFVWGGDAEHPEGGGGRHRLETAALPWNYLRD
ncbi:NUDIX hydrolase [Microbacterium murale]|uniref:8-oxo-dGTP pyrophosphatase MutT (NUDIX family) n=1 Tax=Microbacterium murale TaxID=1081040 RepID=A0ABU0PCQ6_9MICO|nr:NUDIX hydrolase [Microbacterium murale]MDQ0645119.1 8-oxo-dGTP pyrophosphatase MutT (NUDIX family) [Microbacterium murale]